MNNHSEKNLLNYPTNIMLASGEFRDEAQALEVLRASIQALRDRLPKVKAYHLGVRLPESLRHFYFEGWRNDQRQTESINKSEFLAEVNQHLEKVEDWDLSVMVPLALKALLVLVKDEEALEVKEAVPMPLREIFQAGQAA